MRRWLMKSSSRRMTTNYDSVLLIGTLNTFAQKTRNGIIDFKTSADDLDKYDGWLVYDSDNGKVVADMCVDSCCRDIIDYYDFFPDVQIEVLTDVEDENYHIVLVMLPVGCIVVERGINRTFSVLDSTEEQVVILQVL